MLIELKFYKTLSKLGCASLCSIFTSYWQWIITYPKYTYTVTRDMLGANIALGNERFYIVPKPTVTWGIILRSLEECSEQNSHQGKWGSGNKFMHVKFLTANCVDVKQILKQIQILRINWNYLSLFYVMPGACFLEYLLWRDFIEIKIAKFHEMQIQILISKMNIKLINT